MPRPAITDSISHCFIVGLASANIYLSPPTPFTSPGPISPVLRAVVSTGDFGVDVRGDLTDSDLSSNRLPFLLILSIVCPGWLSGSHKYNCGRHPSVVTSELDIYRGGGLVGRGSSSRQWILVRGTGTIGGSTARGTQIFPECRPSPQMEFIGSRRTTPRLQVANLD